MGDSRPRRSQQTDAFVVEFDEPDAAADVHELARWLDDDDELRGRTAVRMRGPDPGEQGGVADAVLVTAPPARVADPLADWLVRRAASGSVRVRVTATSGAVFVAEAAGRSEGDRLAGQLRKFLRDAGA